MPIRKPGSMDAKTRTRRKGDTGMAKLYLNAADVAEIMDCSENYGYKIIAELNTELKSKGYIVRAGRIPKKYFYERAGLDLEEKTNG